jgi:hypothetical protein
MGAKLPWHLEFPFFVLPARVELEDSWKEIGLCCVFNLERKDEMSCQTCIRLEPKVLLPISAAETANQL